MITKRHLQDIAESIDGKLFSFNEDCEGGGYTIETADDKAEHIIEISFTEDLEFKGVRVCDFK